MSKQLTRALDMAKCGIASFPLFNNLKYIPDAGGWDNATTDVAKLKQYFSRPHVTGIGIVPLKSSINIVVIDVDRHKDDGVAELEKLEGKLGILPKNWHQKTTSDGRRIILTTREKFTDDVSLTPNIDMICGKHSAAVAPSKAYKWQSPEEERTNAPKKLGEYTDIQFDGGRPPLIPEAWEKAIKQLIKKKAEAGSPGNGSAIPKDIKRSIEELEGTIGNRHDVLKQYMCSKVSSTKGKLSEAEYEALLKAANLCLKEPISDSEYAKTVRPIIRWCLDRFQNQNKKESGDGNAGAEKKPLVVRQMSSYEVKPTEFLFRPYFPLKVVIMSAYPGSGKTYVGCKLAASVSKGIDFAGIKNLLPQRKKVIYFSSEDGYDDTIGLRLIECHADMDNILAVEFDDDDSLDFTDGRLEELIKQESPALIIFDTLQNFIGDVNMNAANETTAKMRALVRLADQYKCCIILIAHFNKNELGSAITRTIGSTDIVGKCRSYLCVGSVPDEDNEKFLSHEKCNVAPLGDTILFSVTPDRGGITFTGTSMLRADDYAACKRSKGKASPELDTVKDFIIRNMPGGKRESREIETLCGANGFSDATVKRAKKMLGIRSVKEGKDFNNSTWYWLAPEGGFYNTDGFGPVDYTQDTIIGEFDKDSFKQGTEIEDSG